MPAARSERPGTEVVSSGTTGHAESVQVTYDPRQITYGRLLQIYFSVAHDPTELNRQGPDYGTQYRSAIFPTNDEQARIAAAYIAQLGEAHVFPAKVVTKIETGRAFYPAEAYHQDFLTLNPTYPYIVINDLPKVESWNGSSPICTAPTPCSSARRASGHHLRDQRARCYRVGEAAWHDDSRNWTLSWCARGSRAPSAATLSR